MCATLLAGATASMTTEGLERGCRDKRILPLLVISACAAQTPLAAFQVMDAFSLYMPDELHQCDKGLKDYMLGVLRDLLEMIPSARAAVNKSLSETPQYPDLKLPTRGLDTPKLTAREVAALLLCFPVACLPFKKLHAWVECAMGELLRRLLRPERDDAWTRGLKGMPVASRAHCDTAAIMHRHTSR